jgi:PAS domain S-box-containing protein
MSHSSSLAMDWNQGDLGHGSPRKSAVKLRTVTLTNPPQAGMALIRGTAFDPSFRLLLGSLSERVWRMDLQTPVALQTPPEQMGEQILREARLAECNPSHSHAMGAESTQQCIGMTLAEVLIGTPDEHREMLDAFIAGHLRMMDRQTLEWDEQGEPVQVLTNLVGIVEADRLVGLWGVQRSATPGKPLPPTPRPLSQTQSHTMCIADTSGHIMFESPDMERLLGNTDAERKGMLWCDLIHPEDRASMSAAFAANVQDESRASTIAKVRIRRHDGQWLRRVILCQPMTDVPGPALVAISVRPLPNEEQAETKRRRRPAPKGTERMTTQVCTLNNILALISGHAQLATMMGQLDAETQRHLQVIVDAADRASATLGKMVE